ncbi:MAG: glycosyltransferase family 4 protein [bacterium]
MRKVLQVIGGGEIAGSKHQFLELCREQRRQNHEVRIVCFLEGELSQEARQKGIPLSVLPMANIFDFRVVRLLRRLISSGNFQVVHTHGVRANFIGRLAAHVTSAKIVTTIYSYPKEDYKNPLKRWFYPPIDRWTTPWAHRLIAVSEGLKERLVESGVAPAERFRVVHCSIDIASTRPSRTSEEMRRELEIPAHAPAAGMLARLVQVKNPFLLLDAAGIIAQEMPEAKVLFIGDGPFLDPLKKAVEDRRLGGAILFPGFRKDPLNVVEALDVIVLSSISEGLPVTLLEAMCLQKPVVATRVGGVPEVVKDGVTGLLSPSGDAKAFASNLLHLFRHPEEAQRMGRRGLQWVEQNFSLRMMVEKTNLVYEEVLTNGGA